MYGKLLESMELMPSKYKSYIYTGVNLNYTEQFHYRHHTEDSSFL
jgi:hypothetical protein